MLVQCAEWSFNVVTNMWKIIDFWVKNACFGQMLFDCFNTYMHVGECWYNVRNEFSTLVPTFTESSIFGSKTHVLVKCYLTVLTTICMLGNVGTMCGMSFQHSYQHSQNRRFWGQKCICWYTTIRVLGYTRAMLGKVWEWWERNRRCLGESRLCWYKWVLEVWVLKAGCK